MLLLQIWRRGVQWSTEVIYVASICLFGWFGWVFGGWKCDEHPRHPSMQRIPAWCCVCLLPISSENRLYKEVIRPSDKTKWHWKEKSLETIRRLISAFKCRCFPNERQLHPCYASHFLTVLRTTRHQPSHFAGLPRSKDHLRTRSLPVKFSTRSRISKRSWRRITKGEAPYEQPSKRIEDSANNMQYQHVTSDRWDQIVIFATW